MSHSLPMAACHVGICLTNPSDGGADANTVGQPLPRIARPNAGHYKYACQRGLPAIESDFASRVLPRNPFRVLCLSIWLSPFSITAAHDPRAQCHRCMRTARCAPLLTLEG